MRYQRTIGIIVTSFTAALILQIAIHHRSGLKTWRMTSKPVAIPAVVRSLRPVYPYSVIPGGVYSREELEQVRGKDRLVHEHYADFNLAAAHLVTTDEVRYAYVSYRLGGQILWTTHKLRIPKGETLLTDGVNFCRTRCGNRLSERPHREISAIEPPIRLLSLPNFTPSLLANNLVGLDLPIVTSASPAIVVDEARLAPVLPSSGAAFADREFKLPISAEPFAASLIAVPAPLIYLQQKNPKLIGLTQNSPTQEPTSSSEVPEPQTLALGLIAMAGIYGLVTLRKRIALTASGNQPRR